MDEFDALFAILVVTILSLVFSCVITNERISNIKDRVNVLEQKIAPVKTPEQLKIENLEKQVEKLTDSEKVICGQ